MSRAGGQARTCVAILERLRPHFRTDAGLPDRIEGLLRSDRRLGSNDRRLYRELVYAAVRHLPWIEPLIGTDPGEAIRRAAWLAPETRATQRFRGEIAGDLPACPASARLRAGVLGEEVRALVPDWFRAECGRADDPALVDCLLSRAPLWTRLRRESDREAVQAEWTALGWAWSEAPCAPGAFRLPLEAAVGSTAAFVEGRIEVQDVGSQRVLGSIPAGAGGRWLDACAGAGGKTLALCARLGPEGRVDASDPRRGALEELLQRARRAGCDGQIRLVDGPVGSAEGPYDGVLVDAPCSGSGTWRRSPHLRWTGRAAGVARLRLVQASVLGEQARRVRPGGGRLIYATCSLCRSENEAVVGAFLGSHPDFEADGGPGAAGQTLWPDEHDGDGFYVAALRRR